MAQDGVVEALKVERPMTVQIVRTKAETALIQAYDAVERELPGGAWLKARRSAAIGSFAAQGLPNRRVEEWKYTDLRAGLKEMYPLATGKVGGAGHSAEAIIARILPGVEASGFVHLEDGRGAGFAGIFSSKDDTSPYLADLLGSPPAWLRAELERGMATGGTDGIGSLNAAFFANGVVLDIPSRLEIDQPLVMLFTDGGEGRGSVFSRSVIRVGDGAKVTLVEVHCGNFAAARQVSAATQLMVGRGAMVTHIKFVETEADDVHTGKWDVRLGSEATYRPFQMTLGSGLVRNELALSFDGQHSTLDFGAAFLAGDRGHIDTTLLIDHKVGHCTSRELVKGVLDNAARGIFQGKVIVQPNAQKTDGKQMAQALMLSADAEFDSKPELEIYADDVVCGHGSTSAELDDDLLFYLRARGIPLAEAKSLLVESFIGEAIDKVEHDGLREAMMGHARRWLAAGHVGA
jgi:Fe-S cluster assembly protein SufD